MTEKARFDLDAALAALGREEEAARPAVSQSLQARVLGDAAAVAAGRLAAPAGPAGPAVPAPRRRRFLGLFDAWSGAAVAAFVLCLAIGFGVGYEAGSGMIWSGDLDGAELAQAPDDGDVLLWEDVL
jgi:hypothetical protein